MSRRAVCSGAPAIGICAAVERVSWGVWDGYEVTLAPRNYVQRGAAGRRAARSCCRPTRPRSPSPDLLLDRVDALMLAGGADIDPASYGAEPHPRDARAPGPSATRFELALARRALERDMPVLGICRGMQLLNVACGGTLDQHLADAETHRTTAGTFSEHDVRLEPGSLPARRRASSACRLVPPPPGRRPARRGPGRAAGPREETVEAIELPGKRFALGVVWHPEEDGGAP